VIKTATIYSNQITVSIQTGPKYDLHVMVEDIAGVPIVGATVTAGNNIATTNYLGFVDLYLPAGAYTLTVNAPDYIPLRMPINLQGNDSLIVQLKKIS
jgi:hypothetical protein